MFSADEDARREEDGVAVSIELSSLNWRDSGNESVLVVEGDRLGFPRSLNMDPSSVDIVDIRTEKIGRPRRDSCSGSQRGLGLQGSGLKNAGLQVSKTKISGL